MEWSFAEVISWVRTCGLGKETLMAGGSVKELGRHDLSLLSGIVGVGKTPLDDSRSNFEIRIGLWRQKAPPYGRGTPGHPGEVHLESLR